MGKRLGFMAVDQYGHTVHLTEPTAPRKQLLEKLGACRAEEMYCDDNNGKPVCVGYIVGSSWFNLYEVHAWASNA